MAIQHIYVNGVSWEPSYCHTRLHLGFSAKQRIWQGPACKREPRSGNISWKNHPPTHPAISIFVSLSVRCVPPSVSVWPTHWPYQCLLVFPSGASPPLCLSVVAKCLLVFPSSASPPPKNLASSSLQDGIDLTHSTWISSVALPA